MNSARIKSSKIRLSFSVLTSCHEFAGCLKDFNDGTYKRNDNKIYSEQQYDMNR
jgi:hypothetical protein